MRTPKINTAAAYVESTNSIMLFGGLTLNGETDVIEEYDLARNQWRMFPVCLP